MEVIVNGEKVLVENYSLTESSISLTLDGKIYAFAEEDLNARVSKIGKENTYQVFWDGIEAEVAIVPKVTGSGRSSLSEGSLTSPMPGKVFKVMKNSGDTVSKGEAILIIEAMKMEHTIRAQKDGVIAEIFYREGDQVDGGVSLVEIE